MKLKSDPGTFVVRELPPSTAAVVTAAKRTDGFGGGTVAAVVGSPEGEGHARGASPEVSRQPSPSLNLK